MEGHKLLGRMEEVQWNPPVLSFTIERHGCTVMGSSRATLQEWTVDLERKTAWCEETRTRQIRPMQRRLDVRPLAEEITRQVVGRCDDRRLLWHADGRVRVLVGKILPERSACKQTLIARRKRFRKALDECLEREGWELSGFWYIYSLATIASRSPAEAQAPGDR
jgi:hypothetical protein